MSANQHHISRIPQTAPQGPASAQPPVPAAEFIHTRLVDQARRAAAALTRLGVHGGERVAALLPMTPESVVTTMACGRLGARRFTLPIGDPAYLLRDRIQESGAGVVITADGCFYGDRYYPAKRILDRALADCPAVRSVLVVHRMARPVPWTPGRDHWWHEALTLDA
ncbi:AMP-binding protein [Streptomyces gobiensis]|uniref:AMP-binding protein n=1 Tax=Streptomyces gobiensis TaxID=2875706 RepID=UPI001E514DC6|nr:AMP-binding protein [Streptomyces gobiensis]UGY91904.1 AMP-binding protein [Streptomyces gobiensis]